MGSWRFDADYAERLRLFDGTETLVRLARPEDAPLLQAGFAALTPETRYLRFFAHKSQLDDREARALVDLDDRDELAVGAVGAPGSAVEGMPMGVARFARLDERAAEAAVVVVDAFQRRGLATALLARLGEAAAERGFDTLVFETLPDNRALVALVRKVFPNTEVERTPGGPVVCRAPLPPRPASAEASGAPPDAAEPSARPSDA